ncbi:hypothetical protein KKH05_00255 [Patescibacteria group bacterium]|nr:hypothetical protein [Patescibacteria group bacterium]
MNNKNILIGLAVIVGLVLVFWALGGARIPGSQQETQLINGEEVVLYKDANCGCCGVYASYLQKEGITAKVENVANLDDTKSDFSVAMNLQSCHTMKVGEYVVEGHVPIEVINKLLTERPAIKGIALPGMPSGSPGMPGPKTSPFVIYTIGGAEGEIYITI